ncbi:MAG: hypothetical protein QE271_10375 [Bacteriovoracaceae bacterium]|nr:hypothetical protein [Bacteriovoracaceae bacterium]
MKNEKQNAKNFTNVVIVCVFILGQLSCGKKEESSLAPQQTLNNAQSLTYPKPNRRHGSFSDKLVLDNGDEIFLTLNLGDYGFVKYVTQGIKYFIKNDFLADGRRRYYEYSVEGFYTSNENNYRLEYTTASIFYEKCPRIQNTLPFQDELWLSPSDTKGVFYVDSKKEIKFYDQDYFTLAADYGGGEYNPVNAYVCNQLIANGLI